MTDLPSLADANGLGMLWPCTNRSCQATFDGICHGAELEPDDLPAFLS